MSRTKGSYLISLHNRILVEFGQDAIAAARDRLCRVCVHRVREGWPCQLLPIESSGADCSYFGAPEISREGGNQNG